MRQVAVAGKAALQGQTQPVGAVLRLGGQGWIVGLRLIDQLGVIAEIHITQGRVFGQAKRLPHKGIELPHQEIGQVERCHFVFGGESVIPFKKRIAMRASDHFNA